MLLIQSRVFRGIRVRVLLIVCRRPVKCGQTIRLMHLQTRKNLHSHHFQSPLSNNFEVSAFGEDGVGDEGDNWIVTCGDTYWEKEDRIRFKHIATGGFVSLASS